MLIVAHRGYHRVHPENTLLAFEAAREIGVDGIETDVRRTRDGEFVLYHDAEAPNRKPVSDLSKSELEDVAGYEIPTLAEALRSLPELFWNIEVKAPADVFTVAQELRRHHEVGRLLLTSFDHDFVVRLAAEVDMDCGLLFDTRRADFEAYLERRKRQRLRNVVIDYQICDERVIGIAHALQLRTFVYGVHSQQDHRRCLDLELAGVITDYPERMAMLLGR
jgi:glycerophosphoryl diester phosphodiesterase